MYKANVRSLPSRSSVFPTNVNSLLNLRSKISSSRSFSTPADLDPKRLKIQHSKNPQKKSPAHTLLFGREFSDHMLEVDWKAKEGWGEPKITDFHNFSLSPACSVFHYATELFEGMKAYKDAHGKVRLFRPDKNIERFNNSAVRIALPTVPPAAFLSLLKQLVIVDKDWIPSGKGYSLYIRPTLIGTQASLGVSPSDSAKFFVICSPVGPYYPEGWKPVKLLASDKYCRAWPGGSGNAKLGANYAPGIMPQVEAAKRGYTQILWLFGPDHNITEVGTMNMFIYWTTKDGKKELVTPPLDGTILPGVTRDSVLGITREWNEFKVTERPVTMKEFVEALKEGRVLEAFGAGTAAVVSPIKVINYQDVDYSIPLDKNDPSSGIGPLAKRIADTIMGIQYGEIPHPWSVVVD